MTEVIFPLATLANAIKSDSDILKLQALAPEYKQYHILARQKNFMQLWEWRTQTQNYLHMALYLISNIHHNNGDGHINTA